MRIYCLPDLKLPSNQCEEDIKKSIFSGLFVIFNNQPIKRGVK